MTYQKESRTKVNQNTRDRVDLRNITEELTQIVNAEVRDKNKENEKYITTEKTETENKERKIENMAKKTEMKTKNDYERKQKERNQEQ